MSEAQGERRRYLASPSISAGGGVTYSVMVVSSRSGFTFPDLPEWRGLGYGKARKLVAQLNEQEKAK